MSSNFLNQNQPPFLAKASHPPCPTSTPPSPPPLAIFEKPHPKVAEGGGGGGGGGGSDYAIWFFVQITNWFFHHLILGLAVLNTIIAFIMECNKLEDTCHCHQVQIRQQIFCESIEWYNSFSINTTAYSV